MSHRAGGTGTLCRLGAGWVNVNCTDDSDEQSKQNAKYADGAKGERSLVDAQLH